MTQILNLVGTKGLRNNLRSNPYQLFRLFRVIICTSNLYCVAWLTPGGRQNRQRGDRLLAERASSCIFLCYIMQTPRIFKKLIPLEFESQKNFETTIVTRKGRRKRCWVAIFQKKIFFEMHRALMKIRIFDFSPPRYFTKKLCYRYLPAFKFSARSKVRIRFQDCLNAILAFWVIL